jgi:hypothetical protein
MLNLRLGLGLVTCLALLVLTVPAHSARRASCSGSDCNGQNPFATGCADDAYVAASGAVRNDTYIIIGSVTLYWSDTCQAGYTKTEAVDTAHSIAAGTYGSSYYNVISANEVISVTSNMVSAASPAALNSCGSLRMGTVSQTGLLGGGCAQ